MFAAYSVCVDAVGCDARSRQQFGRLGAQRKITLSWSKGETQLLLNICERLGYQQVFKICTNIVTLTFSREWLANESGMLCLLIRVYRNISGKCFFISHINSFVGILSFCRIRAKPRIFSLCLRKCLVFCWSTSEKWPPGVHLNSPP